MEKSSLKQIHHELNWGEGDLVAAGFSWPPRSYICSFCKREFRSAQALGGHMNVHRRDRARLRQLSPTAADTCNSNPGNFSLLNLNLDPNPGFNPNPSSLLTKFPHFSSKLPPPADLIKWGGDGAVQPAITTDFMKPKGLFEDLKKSSSEFVTLDLEIGLISQSKEELDLELRLGYT